jgi:hypothetical protein
MRGISNLKSNRKWNFILELSISGGIFDSNLRKMNSSTHFNKDRLSNHNFPLGLSWEIIFSKLTLLPKLVIEKKLIQEDELILKNFELHFYSSYSNESISKISAPNTTFHFLLTVAHWAKLKLKLAICKMFWII